MNTCIDIYDVTQGEGDPNAWEDYLFEGGVPIPASGEVVHLPSDPDARAVSELEAYRVVTREFSFVRESTTQAPQMRVVLNVERLLAYGYS